MPQSLMSHADAAPIMRPARSEDVREVAALWCDAFPGRRSLEERVRMLETGGRYGGLDTVILARDEGDRLMAACKVYRMEQRILGVAVPMMGLAAVAVAPAHRRRGLGATICTEAIRIAADRGDIVSTLYPFRPDWYERLGWGLVGELHDYRFRTDHLPISREARHVRDAGRDDGAGIAACYDRAISHCNGPIRRDARLWGYRLADEEIGVRPVVDGAWSIAGRHDHRRRAVVYDNGDIHGYALLRQVETRARGDRRVEVRELVAETEGAYRGLLGYLAARAGRWPLGRHFARPEERFGDRLRDPRPPRHRPARSLYFPTCRVVRGPMLRVLDVPGALRLRPWHHTGHGRGPAMTVRVTVRDNQITDNIGPWMVRLDGTGGGTVARTSAAPGTEGAADAAIATDAATFARIHVGELAPTAAERIGRATLHGDKSMIDGAFATDQRFWLPDEF